MTAKEKRRAAFRTYFAASLTGARATGSQLKASIINDVAHQDAMYALDSEVVECGDFVDDDSFTVLTQRDSNRLANLIMAATSGSGLRGLTASERTELNKLVGARVGI